MVRKLTPKQKKFADEYIKSGNATKSAIEAGYSKKTAKSVGSENLTKPDVKSYIEQAMKRLEDEKIMGAKEAIELLSRIARGEETETIVVPTPKGALEVQNPPDIKTRITAVKELMKRYPESNDLRKYQVEKAKADVRKANAEADIAKFKADTLTGKGDESDRTVIVDEWGDNNESN